jgi:hypothetical protein
MLKKLLGLIVLYGLLIPIFGQNLDELLDQVDLKLRKDKKYLNINYISFPNNKITTALQNIPRTNLREPVSFQQKDNITYNVIFLKDAVGVDSVQILYVDEIVDKTSGGEKLFGETTGPQVDTTKFLTFKDIWSIQKTRPEVYAILYNEVERFILENPDQQPPSLLRITPDVEIKTSLGIAARDNTDFLNFMRANSLHYYPKQKLAEKKGLRKSAAQSDSAADFRLDAGFTSISFSHPAMDFSLGGASIEVGVDEKTLNLLPYQTGGITGGFRTLITLADKKEDINKAFIIDAKLLGRITTNMVKLPTSLPFMGGTKPKLQLSNAGGIDLSFTRIFGLPFINISAMSGTADVTNSPLKQIINGKTFAYYNTTTAEGSMSFYWNTSESQIARFRFDIGAGYYDVYSAQFTNYNDSKPAIKKAVAGDIYPLFALHFNFAPDGKDNIFYGMVRFFDSQLKLNGWLKVLELEGGHVFRVGLTYVSQPFARRMHEWETTGGALVQIRYRYGL